MTRILRYFVFHRTHNHRQIRLNPKFKWTIANNTLTCITKKWSKVKPEKKDVIENLSRKTTLIGINVHKLRKMYAHNQLDLQLWPQKFIHRISCIYLHLH